MLYSNPKENETQSNENIISLGEFHCEKSREETSSCQTDNINIMGNFKNEKIEGRIKKDGKHLKNAFKELIDNIPEYQYDIHPKCNRKMKNKNGFNPVPFDQFETSDNRFFDCFEAFLYVGKHCKKYHGKYTRDYCKHYLKECYIIDFVHDKYVPITNNLSKKQFNKYFFYTQRELKYL